MLVAGDEFGRTQQGNNNAYCQDNDISWVDWSWMEEDELSWERQRFEAIKDLISVRTRLEQFHHEAFFTLTSQLGLLKQSSRVQWYLADGTTPNEDDWFNTQQRCFMMRLLSDEHDVIVSINAEVNATDFALPADTEWNLLWSSQPVDLSRQESSRGGGQGSQDSSAFVNTGPRTHHQSVGATLRLTDPPHRKVPSHRSDWGLLQTESKIDTE
jgi:glycogen operon protein